MDDTLSVENLLAGARRFAHLAMAAHDRSDHELFALHGGVAVERLAKAALAAKNPALLLEMRGKVDALFHLTGVKPSESRVHTVGAGEAIARLRKLDVLLSDEGLDDLIELRNGVAHSTQGDEGRELLPALVRTAEALLIDLGKDENAFWERWAETIRLALDEARTDLERDVQLRVQKARNVFQDRFEGLPDDALKRFQETQRNTFAMALMTEEKHLLVEAITTCPACDGQAKVLMNGRHSANNSGGYTVNGLLCPMCHLTLTGAEEFSAAGLNLGHVNNDVVSEIVRMLSGKSVVSEAENLRLGETRPG
ncbi:hypothetical protein [Streptomyces gilvus]|uniref:hypothetical protein n=1 Tax=Streptomyces gilvus TaxID=2920937 RepID=UPI001F0E61DE|nr:hypothetical protein [Streptomyces sp. CME 23]MCH5677927.1 hypothetical protein [Streptomyces sp. CME 23]